MGSINRIALSVLLLVLSVAILIFMLENNQPHALLFLGWLSPPLPIALYIVLALLIGWVTGPLIGLLFKKRRKSIKPRVG